MKSTVFRATGMSHYMDAFKTIREENSDFFLSRKELLETYGPGDKIWKYDYIYNSVELIPEPDNPYDKNAVAVFVDGKMAAHIKRGSCSQVKNLINADDFVKVEAEIGGGPYKYIGEDDDENLYIDKSEIDVFIHLTIYNDCPDSAAAVETVASEKPAAPIVAPPTGDPEPEKPAPKKRSAGKWFCLICGVVLVIMSLLILLVDPLGLVPLLAGLIAAIYGFRK